MHLLEVHGGTTGSDVASLMADSQLNRPWKPQAGAAVPSGPVLGQRFKRVFSALR